MPSRLNAFWNRFRGSASGRLRSLPRRGAVVEAVRQVRPARRERGRTGSETGGRARPEIVRRRLQETRPIWEGVQERLTTIEAMLEDIQSQLREVVRDLYSMRGRIGRLEDRDRSPAA